MLQDLGLRRDLAARDEAEVFENTSSDLRNRLGAVNDIPRGNVDVL